MGEEGRSSALIRQMTGTRALHGIYISTVSTIYYLQYLLSRDPQIGARARVMFSSKAGFTESAARLWTWTRGKCPSVSDW